MVFSDNPTDHAKIYDSEFVDVGRQLEATVNEILEDYYAFENDNGECGTLYQKIKMIARILALNKVELYDYI